jgi:hypothetical protein
MPLLSWLTSSRQTPGAQKDQRSNGRKSRSRVNTAHSYSERYEEPEPLPVRPSIRSTGRVTSANHQDYPDSPESPVRPTWGRTATFEGPTAIQRQGTPVNGRKAAVPNDVGHLRSQLRPTNRINTNTDVFSDPSDSSTANSASPDRSWRDRSISPATSHDSAGSRTASWNHGTPNGKKAPPPPPPTRAKKPPPPPPMKRTDYAVTSAPRY